MTETRKSFFSGIGIGAVLASAVIGAVLATRPTPRDHRFRAEHCEYLLNNLGKQHVLLMQNTARALEKKCPAPSDLIEAPLDRDDP